MNGEDALTADGVDGRRTMEEIDKLQHKKKEKKAPSWKNDNENTQAYTRSSNIPEEELVTSNHSIANSYLVHWI